MAQAHKPIYAWGSPHCQGYAYVDAHEALKACLRDTVHYVRCATPLEDRVCVAGDSMWSYNAGLVYRAFARAEALRVAPYWDAPPVVLRYLKTGDAHLQEPARAAIESAIPTSYGACPSLSGIPEAIDAAATAIDARPRGWIVAYNVVTYIEQGARKSTAMWARSRHMGRRLAAYLTAGRRTYGQRAVP